MTTAADSLIQIRSDALSAQIDPFGAQLFTLKDERGADLLWDGDPAFWTGRAPLLFPVVGALANGRYRHGGQVYELPKHGFARHSQFQVIEADAARALFRLSANEQTRAAYPFDFELDIAFSLDGTTLDMSVAIRNQGSDDMPTSFGFHPAFRWPLPGASRDTHTIEFAHDEPSPMRVLDKNGLLAPAPIPSPIKGRTLRLRDELFQNDALIFDALKSRSLTYGDPAGQRLFIEFPDMPHLGIWTKPGAGYVCIEPWQGYADPAGYDGTFGDKPGSFFVKPGTTHKAQMRVTLLDA